MTIRKANKKDLDQLVYLFDQYRVFYKQTVNPGKAKKFLSKRLKKEDSVILVAAEGKRLLGFTQLYPLFTSVGMQRIWLLNDLYVDEGDRKKGTGAALLDAAKEFGRENGAKWLMLQTAADNFIAQSVYEKNGWKKETDFFYRFDL